VKQPSYDWVLFDLDETLLDFPVASALTHTLQIYGVQADDASMAQYHALNHGLWQQYNDGEIDAPLCPAGCRRSHGDEQHLSGANHSP